VIAHARDERGYLWDLAAKAGHNNEHHNHNDCGSYILNINGVRLITEIGMPEYVKDFFGARRYEFLAARTLGHSLPVINGREQSAGEEFRSHICDCELGSSASSFSIDATRAYPSEAGCRLFLRRIHLDKGDVKVDVRDYFELEEAVSVETAVCTEQEVAVRNGEAVIESPEGLRLRLIPIGGTVVDRVETHQYRGHSGTPQQIRRIVFKPAAEGSVVELGYAIRLVADHWTAE
jgi:hypothetical protein